MQGGARRDQELALEIGSCIDVRKLPVILMNPRSLFHKGSLRMSDIISRQKC